MYLGTVRSSRDRSLASTVLRLIGDAPDGPTNTELPAHLRLSVCLSVEKTVDDRQGAARRHLIVEEAAI